MDDKDNNRKDNRDDKGNGKDKGNCKDKEHDNGKDKVKTNDRGKHLGWYKKKPKKKDGDIILDKQSS